VVQENSATVMATGGSTSSETQQKNVNVTEQKN
jgi:hypothetical protein